MSSIGVITETSESRVHYRVAQFVQESGLKLHMQAVTLATASVIYHKFFRSNNVCDYDPYLIATTSLYLAGKTEEDLSKLRDVINVCYRTLHKNRAPLEIGDAYWSIRQSVAHCELFIMRMLNFKVMFVHPHKFLLHYLESLKHWFEPYEWEKFPIARTCWAMLRDSYLDSTICLHYKPQHIAIAMLYFSVQAHGIEIPFTQEADTKWWKLIKLHFMQRVRSVDMPKVPKNVFDEDVTLDIIKDIIEHLIDMYGKETKVK